ncbi:MAG: Hpt domain-containing protein [Nannocystaceae bacterium]|nr:Hpt domain-containing protein [bacterium]
MNDDARIANARDRLAELRQGFAARLRERVDALETAVAKVDDRQAAAIAEVEQLAHKLAGTAGSYGFHEIGEIAAELEALCGEGFDATQAAELTERMRAALD